MGHDNRRPPKDYGFRQGVGGPGTVTFSHATHATGRAVGCSKCHPQSFAIVKPHMAKEYAATWAAMVEGKSCGVCHNGKEAFSASENCDLCHRE